ncbi:MAG: hypothetical protein ACI92O_000318 [Colwellia sp.]|jgi:hypothetical protein
MGFFSYKTSDTNESIMNHYTDECRPVYMLQPNGEPSIFEASYSGYGVFSGIDVYEWLADKNGGGCRDYGLKLAFKEVRRPSQYYPLKFSFNKYAVYEELPESQLCPRQGYSD